MLISMVTMSYELVLIMVFLFQLTKILNISPTPLFFGIIGTYIPIS